MSDPGSTSDIEAGDIALAELPGASSVVDDTATTPIALAARPTVSVVVCGFTEERWGDLCRAVSSLHRQTEPAQEIILVVDHCPALLRRAQENLAGVTAVPNRMAKGLAGGRNTGVAEARGDVVIVGVTREPLVHDKSVGDDAAIQNKRIRAGPSHPHRVPPR